MLPVRTGWPFTPAAGASSNGVLSSPAIAADGNTVYVGSNDHDLYAVNAATGNQNWAFPTGGYVVSSPAIGDNGAIYVGSNDNNLYAVNPNGSLKWSFPFPSLSVSESPAITSSAYTNAQCYGAASPFPCCTAGTGSGTCGPTIYVGPDAGPFYKIIDTNTNSPGGVVGATGLTSISPWALESSPAIGRDNSGVEGDIYVGSTAGQVYELVPGVLGSLWTFPTPGSVGSIGFSSAAIDTDGTIWIGSSDHNLYAINATPTPTPTATPTPTPLCPGISTDITTGAETSAPGGPFWWLMSGPPVPSVTYPERAIVVPQYIGWDTIPGPPPPPSGFQPTLLAADPLAPRGPTTMRSAGRRTLWRKP